MKSRIAVVINLFAVVVLCSCGNSSDSSAQTGGITTGNWSVEISPSDGSQKIVTGAAIAQSGSAVSFTLEDPSYEACNPPLGGPMPIPLTGSFQGQSLTMSWSPVSSPGTLALTATGAGNSLSGTLSFESLPCPHPELNGSFTATYVPPISGTWMGAITQNGQTVTVTANLTQGLPLGSSGGYLRVPLTGTVTLSGSSCFSGGNLDSANTFLSGDNIILGVDAFNIGGTISNSSPTMSGNFGFQSSVCSGQMGTIQLSRQ